MRWLFSHLLLCLLIVPIGLVACAGSAPAGTAPASGTLVEYRRSGGIAGLDDRLVIAADGKSALTRRAGKVNFTLSADTVKQVETALTSANLQAIPEDSMPKPLVPDALSYEITYQGRKIKTADTAVPKPLEPVLEILNRLVDANGK